eukprot:CAMPEP_0197603290 /NCGR_PEP_ID=MMETSP1326-20131121/38930_1 /TAXON_ID=1155430 /ORGANISM="Genus nov. species nov., Strain RCC2288" /LENGTH=39 /DNA_ID= /DNA_START= /DNA_END= /DNA_ORIENTATION=
MTSVCGVYQLLETAGEGRADTSSEPAAATANTTNTTNTT